MILLVHMLFGAAIGSLINNIYVAMILALLGHYFLDLFPHIEYLEGVEKSIVNLKTNPWSKKLKDISKVFLDFCLGTLLIFLFSKNYPIIYICALIAIIPDGLTVIYSLHKNRVLALHHKIHGEKIHYLTKQKNFHTFWKILTQIIVLVGSVIVLAI